MNPNIHYHLTLVQNGTPIENIADFDPREFRKWLKYKIKSAIIKWTVSQNNDSAEELCRRETWERDCLSTLGERLPRNDDDNDASRFYHLSIG